MRVEGKGCTVKAGQQKAGAQHHWPEVAAAVRCMPGGEGRAWAAAEEMAPVFSQE